MLPKSGEIGGSGLARKRLSQSLKSREDISLKSQCSSCVCCHERMPLPSRNLFLSTEPIYVAYKLLIVEVVEPFDQMLDVIRRMQLRIVWSAFAAPGSIAFPEHLVMEEVDDSRRQEKLL